MSISIINFENFPAPAQVHLRPHHRPAAAVHHRLHLQAVATIAVSVVRIVVHVLERVVTAILQKRPIQRKKMVKNVQDLVREDVRVRTEKPNVVDHRIIVVQNQETDRAVVHVHALLGIVVFANVHHLMPMPRSNNVSLKLLYQFVFTLGD